MPALAALLVPILVSAAIVFVVSSILHTALPWHHNDYAGVPDEEGVRRAFGALAVAPGDYMVPRPAVPGDWKSPEFQKKVAEGPNVHMTVLPKGPFSMGGQLVQWYVYCAVVSLFAAYVACHTLPAGASYLEVFRVTGAVTFAGYSLGLWQARIWFRKNLGATVRSTIDGLIYACLTAGTFGWLWPAQ